MFHALEDGSDPIAFPGGLFERLLQGLRRAAVPVVSLADVSRDPNGYPTLPERAIVITFDDGYRSVFDVAFPRLREYDMPATVFLTAGEVGPDNGPDGRLPSMEGREMISWREARTMGQSGIEFGAHTVTHADLTRLGLEDVQREMLDSKTAIGEALGQPVVSFAYPFGRYDEQSLSLARQHFACACSTRLGFAGHRSDRYRLPRVDAYYLRRTSLVDGVTARWFRWSIYARAIPRRLRRIGMGRPS
jgi:hypothetical protein